MVAGSPSVQVIGGGPAGTAAAIVARSEGAAVTLYEQSRSPRHKVCGEFLSPEVAPVLEQLGLWERFAQANPARIARAVLRIGGAEKRFRLPEPAYSLSRLALDGLLLDEALRRGVQLRRERARADSFGTATVLSHGRSRATARHKTRLFGFKAHFHGPVDDAVELFFFGRSYVGVSPVESSETNVCGLAPEADLRTAGFRPERLFPEALRARLHNLEPSFDWLMTGPVSAGLGCPYPGKSYLAGDALGFVDPYTGSGITNALITGANAGISAARSADPSAHYAASRRRLRHQYFASALLRFLLETGAAGALARWAPPQLL